MENFQESFFLLLKQISLFQNTTEEHLVELSHLFEREVYEEGDLLIEEGEIHHKFFVIARGKVVVTKELDEEVDTRLAILEAGNFLGEFNLLGEDEDNRASAYVEAQTPVICYTITGKKLIDFAQSNPLFAAPFYYELLKELTQRIRRTNYQLRNALIWRMDKE